jgi:hypothetical protein
MRASDELLATFSGLEGRYQLARQFSYLGESDRAWLALSSAVEEFFWFSTLSTDRWLDPIRRYPAFKQIFGRHKRCTRKRWPCFKGEGGAALLGAVQAACPS